ncbi:lysine transporter LysE [Oceanisphaera marina]|uniref:Lysine transporter LysE n=1 Tax=Oceanisphaera marina TaxID=2017550 RepID=A0ABQ1IRR2_9GAMM|nr:LysE family translocator [Oceanisphaera marina]GGB50324.1 lysine transporter LysE [Oceanisphaera marina]
MDPWLLFIPACLALNLTPGPDIFFVLSQAFSERRYAGLWAALGLGLSYLGHTLLAVIGLSALIMQSATAFMVIKYLGAAYLLYLGWNSLRSASAMTLPQAQNSGSIGRIFYRGLMVGLLNPKVALFFLAFLPQFIRQESGAVPLQLLTLGLVFTLTATLCNGAYGLLGQRLKRALQGRTRASVMMNRLSGAIMMALGVRLIM